MTYWRKRSMAKGEPNNKEKSSHDVSDYGQFSTDLEGLHCIKCGEMIEEGQLAFVLNFGAESKKHPLVEVLRFTGLAWHAGGESRTTRKKGPVCLNVRQLPGCENRDWIDEEFARAILPSPQSRMTH
jgi:hypothetical protein